MKYVISLLFSILSSVALPGQTPDLVSLGIDDGMQNGTVQSLLHANDGYVYIGTFTGISRYDGQHVVNIPISETGDGKYNITYAIAEASHHRLYVGDTQGLWQLDASRLTVQRVLKGVIDCRVNAIKRIGHEYLVATANGLFRIDEAGNANVVNLYSARRNNGSYICDIDVVNATDGLRAWVLTATGLVDIGLKNNEGGDYHPFSTKLKPTKVVATRQGRVAIGTEGMGLWMYSPAEHRLWPSAFIDETINDLQLADNGNLLVAANRSGAVELETLTGNIVKCYSDNAVIATVKSRFSDALLFHRDASGIDWIGYKFYGLDHTMYNSGVFSQYTLPDGTDLADMRVVCCMVDGGKVLMGTRNGVYVSDERDGSVRYIGGGKLGGSVVSAMEKHGGGYVVGTTDNGYAFFDEATYTAAKIAMPDKMRKAAVYKIRHDGMGNLWLCTSEGLIRYDASLRSYRLFDTTNSQLPDNEVFCIDFDLGGRGWVSTRGGNCMFLPTVDALAVANMPKRLVGLGALRDIQRLDDGRMLFLPQRGFPVVADANVIRFADWKYDVGEDAPNISFFVYKKGTSYFCTDNGFHVYSNGKLRSFGYIDGFRSMEFQRCCVLANDGRCFVATNKGLAYTTLDRIAKAYKGRRIPIVLTQVQTDHWLTDADVAQIVSQKKIVLERSANGMSVQFQALAYAADSKMQYIYMLEGFDREWRLADANCTAFYPSLPWGTYRLRIKVLGNDNIYGCYDVEVPMAYSTMSMIALLVVVLLIAAYMLWCRYTGRQYLWQRLTMKPAPEKYQTNKVSKADAGKAVRKLEKYMEQQKPYLNADVSMADLAKAAGVSNPILSQIFTQHMHTNYYDFIAKYRVEEFKHLASMPEYSKFTIMAIAEKCGFKSRTSFFTAFKNHTGCTPKEYLDKHGHAE